MIKRKFTWMFVLILISTLFLPVPVHANDEAPPSPIVVTSHSIYDRFDASNVGLHGVVPGPSGNQVTITNRYYPYWQGKVRTDGYAAGNFNQPSNHKMTCQSHAYNNANQTGNYGNSTGASGGNNCPTTTPLAEVGSLVPATYTSWTKAWWRWSDGSSGYGIAQQSHQQQ